MDAMPEHRFCLTKEFVAIKTNSAAITGLECVVQVSKTGYPFDIYSNRKHTEYRCAHLELSRSPVADMLRL